MKTVKVTLAVALLASLCVPARADFKYTETSKITGGALKGAMKFAGVFSKQASQAMKPIVTTRYVKGNRLRSDGSDGQIQIIDIDGRRIINIDTLKHTYSEITFEQMKAALDNAKQQIQQKSDEDVKPDPNEKNVKADVNVKFKVTPGAGTREIMGQSTNESKVDIEFEVQAQQQANGETGQPGTTVNGTIVTSLDTWVAPSVAGYQEFAKFYREMATQIDWVPPSNIHVDPRASQSLDELQKNSDALKGFPLLQYMTMSMVAPPDSSGNTAQSSNASTASSSSSSDSGSTPTSLSGAMTKGLGGLFGRKKKQDDAADQNSQNAPPSTPGSLMEMTIEVNSFSDASLDSSLFEVPAGYTRIEQNPAQIMGGGPAK